MWLRNKGTNIQDSALVFWNSIYVGIPPQLKIIHLSPVLFFPPKIYSLTFFLIDQTNHLFHFLDEGLLQAVQPKA